MNKQSQFKSARRKVDAWGVGTKLITGFDQPALGAVYKLALLKQKMVRLVIELSYLIMRKRSQHQVKRTFIVLSTKTGKAEGDYIT